MNKKINIVTKTGDYGQSRLFSGEKVSKASQRLDAYGDLDELVSVLGVARQYIKQENLKEHVIDIQRQLFIVGSELATNDEKLEKLPKRVDAQMMLQLDQKTEGLQSSTFIPNGFIVPGGSLSAAYLDFARTICRRVERKVVNLYDQKMISNVLVVTWLNRLSDYLYLMARQEEPEPTMVKV